VLEGLYLVISLISYTTIFQNWLKYKSYSTHTHTPSRYGRQGGRGRRKILSPEESLPLIDGTRPTLTSKHLTEDSTDNSGPDYLGNESSGQKEMRRGPKKI